ncbi:type II toxin-antitoxin system VapC family toxin [Leptospira sp. 2 VSF19]|uniref:Type II toxin-antitoxin system VapC family toxin n=1 Tax=Leptospira soteropolitanensis TaxID=2950025 RepID=A0AAW5VLR1_9LEPT|nr:type II toxin-antitoxin system VapC family toxin [Leptospira soteropolitanensis]MCW7494773.1 type II toxin-antitoxin system VapC family toxin [Leptospira soteropolitanensis]MCW7502243.1 type II toxin-antitoxin system VapC family toxin [Leptospira soteropolitanensis]MCW7524603.1 type II toxin-antitoxin system VapC family toxin [Leptospira soteropolitanensis]MCW7528360.1 type II toxin-antitoxin system VapC family toxin [Leptospira soteropolitanensis]MCW7532287.1 type II toxin-antitoxin system
MFFYLDSSVLVKKYFDEFASDTVLKIWKENRYLAISQVGYSEILGTINKKQKIDKFSDKTKESIIKQFRYDWDQLVKINVDHTINSELDRIHSKYLLRGFDAIHLVSAILLFRELEEETIFLSADDNLATAAKKDGLNIGRYN